jgi:hypothetical protein
LTIKTVQGGGSGTTWYTSKITLPIDGGKTDGYHKFETFFYENGNNGDY